MPRQRGPRSSGSPCACLESRPCRALGPTVLLLTCLSPFCLPVPPALGAEPAVSASVREMSFEERVLRSELIFAGEVVAMDTHWNERGNLLQTLYTFHVETVLRSDEPAPRSVSLAPR